MKKRTRNIILLVAASVISLLAFYFNNPDKPIATEILKEASKVVDSIPKIPNDTVPDTVK